MNRWLCVAVACLALSPIGVGVAHGDTREAQRLYQEAVALQQEGKVDQAIDRYKRSLYRDMDNSEALYAMGTAYYEKGDYREAKKTFKDFLAFVPRDYRALSMLARIDLAEGSTKEAQHSLVKVHDRFPQDVPTLIGLAQVEQAMGNRFAGEEYLKRALAVEPDNVELQRMVRKARAANQEYLEAKEAEKRGRILARFNKALWDASKRWALARAASGSTSIQRRRRSPLPGTLTTPPGAISIGSGRLIPYPTVGANGTQIQLVPTGTHLRIYPR